jgi:hypothetical protein
MKKIIYQAFAFVGMAALLTACGGNQQQEAQKVQSNDPAEIYQAASDNGGIKLADGFGAVLVTDGLEATARHITINDNGDIYVKLASLRDGK